MAKEIQYLWVLEMIKERACKTDAERDAMDLAIEAFKEKYGIK